jgi:hypothetical protein
MKRNEIIPVVISALVIVLVAVLQNQSRLVAAVTATMPTKVPLALWVVYAANKGSQKTMETFSRSLLIGIFPTIGFLLAAWFAARAGWNFLLILAVGYAVWGLSTGMVFAFRNRLEV